MAKKIWWQVSCPTKKDWLDWVDIALHFQRRFKGFKGDYRYHLKIHCEDQAQYDKFQKLADEVNRTRPKRS